ncbi:hypothetical protein ATY41_09785 [Leifsonia xyli subsp. xyli]|uniref:Uncharacterized protein n=1 Tax=Leifsonia xyli subsp. xyli TaxID=59736 RepID=A0A1E2SKZ1_LEIXY|nr:hypothetical protein [Leifsonia xyli]ODA90526.1 hypothetical protein ATY41_09785 [Leifsonia xyli subsp. xyli]
MGQTVIGRVTDTWDWAIFSTLRVKAVAAAVVPAVAVTDLSVLLTVSSFRPLAPSAFAVVASVERKSLRFL